MDQSGCSLKFTFHLFIRSNYSPPINEPSAVPMIQFSMTAPSALKGIIISSRRTLIQEISALHTFLSSEEEADIFIEGIPSMCFHKLYGKLGMDDINSPVQGGVLSDFTVSLSFLPLVIYDSALKRLCSRLYSPNENCFSSFSTLFHLVPILHHGQLF